MRSLFVATIALAGMTSLAALAQTSAPSPSMQSGSGARPGHVPGVGVSLPRSNAASNIRGSDTRRVAPTLPAPGVGADATVRTYLHAARTALVAGRTGEAQQALEMAETRALDRSVAQGQVNTPSHSRLVARINTALHTLGAGNRTRALHEIDAAIATKSAG